MVLEYHVLNELATHVIDSLAFTAPAKFFVKKEALKGSLEQTKMEIGYDALVKAVAKARFSSTRYSTSRPVNLLTGISDEEDVLLSLLLFDVSREQVELPERNKKAQEAVQTWTGSSLTLL